MNSFAIMTYDEHDDENDYIKTVVIEWDFLQGQIPPEISPQSRISPTGKFTIEQDFRLTISQSRIPPSLGHFV